MDGVQIIPNRPSDITVIAKCLEDQLAQHHCRGGRVIKQVRQMKTQRALQLLMIENSRVQEAGQNRLRGSGLASFTTDALPNGIAVVHLLDTVGLRACHRFCSAPIRA